MMRGARCRIDKAGTDPQTGQTKQQQGANGGQYSRSANMSYRFSDRIMLKEYLDHAERALENKEIKG